MSDAMNVESAKVSGQGFTWVERDGVPLLQYRPWTEHGITHGFTSAVDQERLTSLAKSLGVVILQCTQVHGANCHLITDVEKHTAEQVHADALLTLDTQGGVQAAVAVRTADCVPVLIRCGPVIAAVHAGWRGIAAAIVPKAIRMAQKHAPGCRPELLIGPCADETLYEVGEEVITQIGPAAVYTPHKTDRYLLNLAQTVAAQVEQGHGANICVAQCPVRTMSNPHFASHRCGTTERGSNISFIAGRFSHH